MKSQRAALLNHIVVLSRLYDEQNGIDVQSDPFTESDLVALQQYHMHRIHG